MLNKSRASENDESDEKTLSANASKLQNVGFPSVHVDHFNSQEETTCIDKAVILMDSRLKQFLLVPLVSILSLLIFPIVLYWSPQKQEKWLYRRAKDIQEGSHVFIEGQGKFSSILNFISLFLIDGNKEIVKLQNVN